MIRLHCKAWDSLLSCVDQF